MELHHGKHHATYVAGFNAASKELEQVEYPPLGPANCLQSGACNPSAAAGLHSRSSEVLQLQAEQAKDTSKIVTLQSAINFHGGGRRALSAALEDEQDRLL